MLPKKDLNSVQIIFIRMHNVAMGYEPRTNSGTSIDIDIIAIANDAVRVPSSIAFDSSPETSKV